MSDTPNLISLKGLDLETSHGPVAVPLPKGNGVITFPDFFDADAEEVEAFMAELNHGMSVGAITPVLKKWLPEKEYEKFAKAYPKYRARMVIAGKVLETLSAQFGDEGEGDA